MWPVALKKRAGYVGPQQHPFVSSDDNKGKKMLDELLWEVEKEEVAVELSTKGTEDDVAVHVHGRSPGAEISDEDEDEEDEFTNMFALPKEEESKAPQMRSMYGDHKPGGRQTKTKLPRRMLNGRDFRLERPRLAKYLPAEWRATGYLIGGQHKYEFEHAVHGKTMRLTEVICLQNCHRLNCCCIDLQHNCKVNRCISSI